MANLARAFGADAARWRWASGTPANVRSLLGAFNVARLDGTFHGAYAYVLDAHGLPARVVMLSPAADARAAGVPARGRAARLAACYSRSRRSIASARSAGSAASRAQRSNATRASARRPPRISTVPSAKRARA